MTFVLIARYRVKQQYQKAFVKESKQHYRSLKEAKGFISLRFWRNILESDSISVLTEWKSKQDCWGYVKKHPKTPEFRVPVEVLERYLYETL